MQDRRPLPLARLAGLARGPLACLVLVLGFQALLLAPFVVHQASSAPPAPARIFAWEPGADALLERVEAVGAVVGDKLYLFGGFADRKLSATAAVDRYDPVSDSWVHVGDMPVPLSHIVPAVDGDTVWIAGGFVGNHPGPVTREVWRYHVPSNSWLPGPALPVERGGGALVRFERALHFFGGFAADRRTTASDHWVLNLDAPTAWRVAKPMPAPRGHLSVLVLDQAIYAIGGQTGHDRAPLDQANVYRYTPQTDTWAEVASLPTPRSHFEPSTFALRGRMVVIGGRNNTIQGQGQLTTTLLYAPAEDQWLRLPALPFTRIAPVAQPVGGQVVVTVGGLQWDNPQRFTLRGIFDASWETDHAPLPAPLTVAGGAILRGRFYVAGAETAALQAYDLAQGAWLEPTALAPRRFVGAGQALVADRERLYLFGGTGAAAGQVQRYDPQANSWSLGAPMPAPASDVVAARAADGSLYVAWAAPQPGLGRYDPGADRWELLPPPRLARSGAAAALSGTRLYLFGGSRPNGPTDTVQVYNVTTKSWATSDDRGSTIPRLPEAQQLARAVTLGGSIYLVGGRGANEEPLSTLYVYQTRSAAWAVDGALPSTHIGGAVAVIADRIYIAGGGSPDSAGTSALSVYNAVPEPVVDSPPPVVVPTTEPGPTPSPTMEPSRALNLRYYLPAVVR